jgi:three-Cys-motif partner protein
MKPPEAYRGREQTFLKHFFLERYLERVAYNILSFKPDFVYVDGFSGPWKSADEAYEDTSFVIALKKLRNIRDGFRQKGKNVRIRCLFNDSDSVAYGELKNAVASVTDIEIKPLCRNFEEVVPDIVAYVGNSFSLTFIDPTGWTGFGLEKIRPLLRLRGEVIVNFMFDFVNRFLEDPRPETAVTFDPLFGEPGWYSEVEQCVRSGMRREDAVLDVYRGRLKDAGQFAHVTSTRILKPQIDRSFFHLVYATRHWKGLVEFRGIEKKAADVQEHVRTDAKLTHKVEKTGQQDLFARAGVETGPRTYEGERQNNVKHAHARMRDTLSAAGSFNYEALLGVVLEIPLVWESDVKHWLKEMRKNGEIEIPGLTGRATIPKQGHQIVWKGARGSS